MTPRAKLACLAAILIAHLTLPLLFRPVEGSPPTPFDPASEPIEVSLQRPVRPPPVPTPDPMAEIAQGRAPPIQPDPAPPPSPIRPRPARATQAVEPAPFSPSPRGTAPVTAPLPVLSDGQLTGALHAGSGRGAGDDRSGVGPGGVTGDGRGGACDMVARLQAALSDDADIRAAVAGVPNAATGAVLVWNGDWIQSPGQTGKGLATVRQAIALEVAFAPPACRSATVSGLAVISLDDGAGAPRLALGRSSDRGAWRWSDLVSTRR